MTRQQSDIQTEELWSSIRANIIGDAEYPDRIYADWTASGRLYAPIEQRLTEIAGSLMANTHTEDSYSGREMTRMLSEASQKIKRHVNARGSDVLINVGTGMTGALARLIRILGWWCHESHRPLIRMHMRNRPLVYITHREHHSNQTMWLESLADVRIIPALEGDEIDLAWLARDLANEPRRLKIASVTAASNVTGIKTPYHEIARLMHQYDGKCFVDFAASAPYVDIDMHPSEEERLDAIYFSPHKFLGGPGSGGVLIFTSELYHNRVPDVPGGGTVVWTNPWGKHRFIADIEQREAGGTPGILQTVKAALAIQLKEEMGTANILAREDYLNALLFQRLDAMKNVRVLSGQHRDRLSIFSILFENLDYRDAVALLSDQYKVETRGGCACAGTYGHHLLNIDQPTSSQITDQLDDYHQDLKPGWVRVSLHPSMTEADVERVADAIEAVSELKDKPTLKPTPSKLNMWGPLL